MNKKDGFGDEKVKKFIPNALWKQVLTISKRELFEFKKKH